MEVEAVASFLFQTYLLTAHIFAVQSTARANHHLNFLRAVFGACKVCRCFFSVKSSEVTNWRSIWSLNTGDKKLKKNLCVLAQNIIVRQVLLHSFSVGRAISKYNISGSSTLQLCIDSKTSIVTTDLTLMRPLNSLGYVFNPLNWSFNLCSAEKLSLSYFWNMQYHTVKPDSIHS